MIKVHANTKHGMKGARFYSIWVGMKTRCFNKNHQWFKHYGGKGVVPCDKWLTFEGFMEDMHPSYIKHVEEFNEKDTTLDRIDGSAGYCKENCRWATKKEQSNNARNNLKIEYKGETKTLQEWADFTGIEYGKLWLRVYVAKMPLEQAFEKIDYRVNKRKLK